MISKKALAFGALALTFVIAAPRYAAADNSQNADSTVSGLQAEVQSLLAEVQTLETQVRALGEPASSISAHGIPPQASAVAHCELMTHTLSLGATDSTTGGEVSTLQQLLSQSSSNYPEGLVTGYFGPLTAQAVANFQLAHGIVAASSSAAGIAGPMTRGALFSWCGHIAGAGNENGNGEEHNNGNGISSAFAGLISGTISAVSGSEITVTGTDGPRTVTITASTTIVVFSGIGPSTNAAKGTGGLPIQGSVSDLTIGKSIVAFGTPGSQGSMDALHIMVGVPLPRNGLLVPTVSNQSQP